MNTNDIGFRDTSKLSEWIVLSLKITMITYALLTPLYIPAVSYWFDTNESLIGLILGIVILVSSILLIVVLIGSVILIFRWIYLSNINSRLMGAKNMKFSPGWAIGWNFIPLMNLFMPFRVMKEIWKTSKDPKNWESLKTPSIIIWWWPMTLTSSLVSQASLRAENNGSSADTLLVFAILDLAVTIIWCILTINLVEEISQMQNQDR